MIRFSHWSVYPFLQQPSAFNSILGGAQTLSRYLAENTNLTISRKHKPQNQQKIRTSQLAENTNLTISRKYEPHNQQKIRTSQLAENTNLTISRKYKPHNQQKIQTSCSCHKPKTVPRLPSPQLILGVPSWFSSVLRKLSRQYVKTRGSRQLPQPAHIRVRNYVTRIDSK